MKVKILVEDEDKGREFKVRKMNLDQLVVNYPTGTGLKNYNYDEVELISEGEIDDFLINNKYMLKIKLNRGISVFFYKAIKDAIEEEMNEELIHLNLLRDKYNVSKRGMWEKELICVINDKIPVVIRGRGQNFKREGYSIIINPIEINSFLESAKEEINKIKLEIQRKEVLLARYGRAINKIKNNSENAGFLLLE